MLNLVLAWVKWIKCFEGWTIFGSWPLTAPLILGPGIDTGSHGLSRRYLIIFYFLYLLLARNLLKNGF